MFFGGDDKKNLEMHDNSNVTSILFVIAEKHQIVYGSVPSPYNGRTGKTVEVIDCGCGYGGLLGMSFCLWSS